MGLLGKFFGRPDGGGEDEVDEYSMYFLPGKLQVHVIQAEDLPDTDTTFFNIDGKDVTDAYVTGELGSARIFKTKYILNSLHPVWDEKFNLYVCHSASSFHINVKDKEHVGAEWIAACSIRLEELVSGTPVEGWFDLINGDKPQGRIKLSVKYTPKDELDEDCLEVPKSYFPMRENNRVTLYQDADTPQLPVFDLVTFPDNSPYQTTRAWRDLFVTIKEAQRFLYITGWSVFTGISLVRGGDDEYSSDSNIGELLKQKAAEGVKVLLMVWDEKLSTESSPGLMGTHDEETRMYFMGTGVECVLVPRMKREGVLASSFVGTCYTHHQKTVIADTPAGTVVAFVGGLDITDGRYDNPEFQLWSTIGSLHAGDFYNNCVPGVTKETGPREPWHDCHTRVEGPAALDVMKNFEERWSRQAEDKVQLLFQLDPEEFSGEVEVPEQEGGGWNVQLFRSITSDSCLFDLDRVPYLHSKDGMLVENTILRALVVNIRNARNFIYLENQYFLGSAYSWFGDTDAQSMHVMPREISQKIVDKIASGESFKVYALIPMFPEGDPSTAPIQEILFWQFRTMETMYRRIARAIRDAGARTHPTDYLNFYCLGKRESPEDVPEGTFMEPPPDTLAEKVHKSRRHCIYVHSKMTLFDDQYVVVGSANINERSLAGNRDTEIAVGAFQPDHTLDGDQSQPRGGVHTYRMALWAAHLGGADQAYMDPSSDECLARVREVTQQHWELYTAEEPTRSDVHLLPYPIRVDEEGRVSSLEAPWDCFPDTAARVLGVRSGYLPGKLTT